MYLVSREAPATFRLLFHRFLDKVQSCKEREQFPYSVSVIPSSSEPAFLNLEAFLEFPPYLHSVESRVWRLT